MKHTIPSAWNISDPKTYKREIEASKNVDCADCLLITSEEEHDVIELDKNIHVCPAWKYCLPAWKYYLTNA